MKRALLILLSTLCIGCSHSKAFILRDEGENRYFVLESINNTFEKNQIAQYPLIVINGIPFRYDKKQDTIILPLKKSDLISLEFLNQNSSRIIYNEKENDGAIIIRTKIQTNNP